MRQLEDCENEIATSCNEAGEDYDDLKKVRALDNYAVICRERSSPRRRQLSTKRDLR